MNLTEHAPMQSEIQPTDEEVRGAFSKATDSLLKMTLDPRLTAAMVDNGIDPYDMSDSRYWDTLSGFADTIVRRGRENGASELAMSTFELVTATPAAVLAQTALDKNALPSARTTSNENVIGSYNSKLGHFIDTFPAVRTEDLSLSLLSVANRTIENSSTRLAAGNVINSHIRGMQHEHGFGQMLEHTGRQFRPGGEDDEHGIDYYVTASSGREMKVDVKASLKEMTRLGHEGSPYAFKPDGQIAMYSLLKDSDFKGHLGLPEDVVAAKAPALEELLSHAESGRTEKLTAALLNAV